MGAKPRLSKAKVRAALIKSKGGVYLAASNLGVVHGTVYNYLERFPELKELKESFDGELVDKGVFQLHDAVESGDPWAVKYALSTKGKDRGYTERQEITGADGNEIIFKVVRD